MLAHESKKMHTDDTIIKETLAFKLKGVQPHRALLSLPSSGREFTSSLIFAHETNETGQLDQEHDTSNPEHSM